MPCSHHRSGKAPASRSGGPAQTAPTAGRLQCRSACRAQAALHAPGPTSSCAVCPLLTPAALPQPLTAMYAACRAQAALHAPEQTSSCAVCPTLPCILPRPLTAWYAACTGFAMLMLPCMRQGGPQAAQYAPSLHLLLAAAVDCNVHSMHRLCDTYADCTGCPACARANLKLRSMPPPCTCYFASPVDCNASGMHRTGAASVDSGAGESSG